MTSKTIHPSRAGLRTEPSGYRILDALRDPRLEPNWLRMEIKINHSLIIMPGPERPPDAAMQRLRTANTSSVQVRVEDSTRKELHSASWHFETQLAAGTPRGLDMGHGLHRVQKMWRAKMKSEENLKTPRLRCKWLRYSVFRGTCTPKRITYRFAQNMRVHSCCRSSLPRGTSREFP